ncbi:MAG: hypothetical protein Q4C58_00790 [Eubacteriales bacterium]|nr:hypothetical protein [Eubacteriales bacterium]
MAFPDAAVPAAGMASPDAAVSAAGMTAPVPVHDPVCRTEILLCSSYWDVFHS